MRAARREDSSADSASACRSIMAATWATTKAKKRSRNWPRAPGANIFSTELDLTADGNVTMKIALPDSGSNAATALAALVAEMLGFTTRDHIRLIWGDSDIAPLSDEWFGGRTITLQGAAICNAADKLRKDLLARAAEVSENRCCQASDPRRRHFLDGRSEKEHDLRRAGQSQQRPDPPNGPRHDRRRTNRAEQRRGRVLRRSGSRHLDRQLALRSRQCIRTIPGWSSIPLVSEADMVGSLMESTQVATDSIPWDREFPGTRHYSVGYLVLPASHHHGHSQSDAGLHRQSGAALVLRREELQRNQHRRGAGRDLQRDLQRLRRAHSRASHHAGKNHGRAHLRNAHRSGRQA